MVDTTRRLSYDDIEALKFKPNISFLQPLPKVGPQATEEPIRTFSEVSSRVNNIINGYKNIDKLAQLAQARIDSRSGSLTITLDRNKDQTVLQAMRRMFPAQIPTEIPYTTYRKALDCLGANAKKHGKQFIITAEERMKAKATGFNTTAHIANLTALPGQLRPELQNPVMPDLDMEEHQKNLIIILFEQMLPMIINTIMILLDPFFSGEDAGPNNLPAGTIYKPPESLSDVGNKVKTKVSEILKQNLKNKDTSPFALPTGSLDQAFIDEKLNAVHVSDCAVIAKSYERGAMYTFKEPAVFAPISRILQNDRVFSQQAIDSLSFTITQLPDVQQKAEKAIITNKDGDIQLDKRSTAVTVLGVSASVNNIGQPDTTSSLEDFANANLRDELNEHRDGKTFVDGLEDLVKRQSDGPGNPDQGFNVLGQQHQNSWMAKDAEDLGKNLLADCIPCAGRILDILDLQPGDAILDMLQADIQNRLGGISQIADLLSDTSIYKDLCMLFQFFSFMCIPDLQMMIAALIAFIMSFIPNLASFFDLLIGLLGPLLSPLLTGLPLLLEQFLTVLLGPIQCILDAIQAQMRKLSTLDDVFKAAGRKFSDFGEVDETVDPIGNADKQIQAAQNTISDIPGDAADLVEGIRSDIGDIINENGLDLLWSTLKTWRENAQALTNKWIQDFEQFIQDLGLGEAAYLNGSMKLLSISRLIGLIAMIIDLINDKEICKDPKIGIMGDFDRFINDHLNAADYQITIDRKNDRIHVREWSDEDRPNTFISFGNSKTSALSTEFDNLVEFAGQDVVKKLTTSLDATIPIPPHCLGKVQPGDVDKINRMMRQLTAVTV